MFCKHCGTELPDGSKFCATCGNSLEEVEESVVVEEIIADASSGAVVVEEVVEGAAAQAVPNEGATQSGYQPYAGQPVQSDQQPATWQSAPAQPQRGPFGQAWNDIVHSVDWIKRVLVIMVMKCVPILGMFASGYNLQWGADAAAGNPDGLPKGTFNKKAFLMGLFYWILSVLYMIANTWLFLIGIIPLLGWLIMIAVLLFAAPFFYLAAIRMTMFNNFWAAFDISKIMAKYKTKVGSLLAASILPSLIIGAILGVIVAIIIGIGVGVTAVGLSSPSYGYGYYDYSYGLGAVSSILGMLGGMTIAFAFVILLSFFLSAFAEIWTLRGVGIWVNRYAPDWKEEAAEARRE